MKTQTPISERKFVRSFTAVKNEHRIEVVAQPYIIGMYVAVHDTMLPHNPLQLTPSHKTYPKWVNNFLAKLAKAGYEINKEESLYINFHSEEDIAQYNIIK